MNHDTLPSAEEIHRVITLEGYNTVLEEFRHQPFIYRDDDDNPTAVIINPGSYAEIEFRKAPDGTLEATDDVLNGPIRTRQFSKAWQRLKGQIKNRLTSHAAHFLGEGHLHNSLDTANQGHNPVQLAIQELGASSTVYRPLNSASAAIANAVAGGQIRNADAVGSSLLLRMLGKENISFALNAASSHATWNDFNYCLLHREEIERAMTLNPNAVLAWFRLTGQHPHQQGQPPGRPENPQAETIIREARHFIRQATSELRQYPTLLSGELPGIYPAIPPAETVWEAFCNLNTASLRRHPPTGDSHVWIAATAVQAGANPTMSAVNAYMEMFMKGRHNTPSELIQAFFRESRKRAQRPSKTRTQQSLVNQFRAAAELPQEALPPSLSTDPNPENAWEDWLRALPESVALAGGLKPSSKPKTKPRDLTNAQWNQAMSKVEQFLTGPGLEEAKAALQSAVRLEISPDAVTLHTNHSPNPVLSIVKTPEGAIIVEGSEHYSTNNLNLDHPDGPRRCREKHYHEPVRTCEHALNITSRGLVNDAARNAVQAVLERHGQEPRDGNPATRYNMTTEAVRRLAPHLPRQMAMDLSDQHASARIREALNAMTDPKTLRTAADDWDLRVKDPQPYNAMSKVPLNIYNLHATASRHLAALQRSNPGALQWAVTTGLHLLKEQVNHPGQIIAAAKVSMTSHGLHKNAWKTAAALSKEAMAAVTQALKPQAAAVLLNALANAAPHRDPEATVRILLNESTNLYGHRLPEAMEKACEDISRHPGLSRRNCQTMVNLLARHRNLEEETRSVTDVADYVQALNLSGIPVRATTWRGLTKASNAWHRRAGAGLADSQWVRILAENEGTYLNWDSLIPSFQASNGLVMESLNSEYELYLESKRMDHCVIRYGQDCSKGTSRCYRINQGGAQVGTGEIRRTNGHWTPVQTRAKHNHLASLEAEQATLELALAYNRAWNSTKGRKSRSWTEIYQDSLVPRELQAAAD